MADRTSASIFAKVFEYLAEDNSEKARDFARKFYADSQEYDFNAYQMYCDDALLKLGLAKQGVHPDYPEDGETILYLHQHYEEEEAIAPNPILS